MVREQNSQQLGQGFVDLQLLGSYRLTLFLLVADLLEGSVVLLRGHHFSHSLFADFHFQSLVGKVPTRGRASSLVIVEKLIRIPLIVQFSIDPLH